MCLFPLDQSPRTLFGLRLPVKSSTNLKFMQTERVLYFIDQLLLCKYVNSQ